MSTGDTTLFRNDSWKRNVLGLELPIPQSCRVTVLGFTAMSIFTAVKPVSHTPEIGNIGVNSMPDSGTSFRAHARFHDF